jgi:YbgC/YbaW family acyl-CoA thioester hydrolase
MTTRRLRVAWVDTDASGRIHHTAALRWAELVEHEHLRALGVADLTSFPRRAIRVEFSAPLRFDDEFDLTLEVEHVGRTSVRYVWRAARVEPDGGLVPAFEGHTTVVLVDSDERPRALPPELRAALTSAEEVPA